MVSKFYAHWRASFTGIPPQIWFLSFVSLVNRIGAMVIAFLAIYLNIKLGFTIEQTGYISVTFGIGALAGAFIGGQLTDKIGYYPVQFWSLICNGAVLILMILPREFWQMCLAVFAMGFAAEIFRPANSVAMALHSQPENRTRSISLYRMSVNLGWALAPALGGLLVYHVGWNAVFWVDGLTCFAAAIVLRLTVPEKKPEKKEKDADNKAVAITISPYKNGRFMFFILLTVLGAITFMQILWTVPPYWRNEYHWSEDRIGLVIALNGLLVFLVEMLLVHSIEGRFNKLRIIQVGLLLYALSYLCFMGPFGFLTAAILFNVFISFGEMLVMPFSSNYVFGKSEGNKQGQYMGVYTMAYSLANIIAPFFGTQMIVRFGYPALWYTVAVLALIVCVGIWLLKKAETRAAYHIVT